MTLEDELGDVVRKARRGNALSERALAGSVGLPEREIREIEAYRLTPNPDTIARIAEALHLKAPALASLAAGKYQPDCPPLSQWGCIEALQSRYGSMTVNCYLIWDPASREALLVDTGTDYAAIAGAIERHGLTLRLLGLTHTHGDHIAVLDEVRQSHSPRILCSEFEPVRGGETVRNGHTEALGSLEVRVLETSGHSPGGLSFHVTGFDSAPGVAATGDALFAGSAGGANASYENLIRNIHTRLLSLAPDTLLLPGHGPLTTVEQEQQFNPFAP